MHSTSLPFADVSTVFIKMSNARLNPTMMWSHSKAGWKRLIAFDPTDQYTYFCGEGQNRITEFYQENIGKLLIGYISYDLGVELLGVKSRHPKNNFPDISFSAFDHWIEFADDHLIVHTDHHEIVDKIKKILNSVDSGLQYNQQISFTSKPDRNVYKEKFERIIDYILSGDIYQVNYTHQIKGETILPPHELFIYLVKKNPVEFAAFIPMDNGSILSLSPERFIKTHQKKIITKPIKGTRPRSDQFDEMMKKELLESSKEEAELYMITDLLRNDLGKICEIGTVNVVNKKEVQKLSSVWHTYSTIEGTLRDDISPMDALLSMSPGGSITGCPKKRAVEIIDELETQRRGVYTGSIGVIYPNGDLDMNIAIRTIVQQGKNISLGVGGGITLDSKQEDEYNETMAKASSFSNTFDN